MDSDGKIEFTRARPGEFNQVYTGQMAEDFRSMQGSFAPGGVWSATFSPLIGENVTGTGKLAANKDQFQFKLTLTQTANKITGTITTLNGVEPKDNVFGRWTPTAE